MSLITPSIPIDEAPRFPGGERYQPLFPHIIGRLTTAEAADFSRPFSWDDIDTADHRRNNAGESIYIGQDPESAGYVLPDGLEQFHPAIQRIAANERGRFPRIVPHAVKLTVRQGRVETGENQHTRTRRTIHRDARFGTNDHFYVVSDTNPTEFYADQYRAQNVLELPDPGVPPSLVPQPYEIVGASASMFHRSPHVREPVLRTFLRVTFKYDFGR